MKPVALNSVVMVEIPTCGYAGLMDMRIGTEASFKSSLSRSSESESSCWESWVDVFVCLAV